MAAGLKALGPNVDAATPEEVYGVLVDELGLMLEAQK